MESQAYGQFIFRDRYRYVVLVVSTLCISSIFSNVVTMNFTVNCMDPSEYKNNTEVNFPLHTYDAREKSVIQWTISLTSMLATFPFSYLCTRFGAKYLFLASGILSAVATGFIPPAASWGFGWLVLTRVFQGISYACDFAVIGVISTRWAALSDISIFLSVLTLFPAFSNIFTNPLAGFVCSSSLGWPWVHYLHGAIGLFLFTLWFIFYTDLPENNKFVSSKELKVIQEQKSEAHKAEKRKIPYVKVVKNPIVWTVWLNAFVDLFAAFFFILYGPTYNAKVLNYDPKNNGLLGALEYAGIIPLKILAGYASDKYNCLPERQKMWVYNTLCTVVPGLIFIVVCYLPTSIPLLTIILFAVSNAFVGFNGGGYYRCAVLVTRQYAEFVLAFTQFIKSACFFIAPLLVELFVKDERNAKQWHIIFWIMAVFLILANVVFCYFATDKPASFVIESENNEETDEKRRKSSSKFADIDLSSSTFSSKL